MKITWELWAPLKWVSWEWHNPFGVKHYWAWFSPRLLKTHAFTLAYFWIIFLSVTVFSVEFALDRWFSCVQVVLRVPTPTDRNKKRAEQNNLLIKRRFNGCDCVLKNFKSKIFEGGVAFNWKEPKKLQWSLWTKKVDMKLLSRRQLWRWLWWDLWSRDFRYNDSTAELPREAMT